MTGCPGKELFGKKVKLEVGDEGALILDLNDSPLLLGAIVLIGMKYEL